jgi:spermidine synthase
VFETRSPLSGRIRVVEDRSERRLVVAGDILSVYPLDGGWSRLRREYWARAVMAAPRRGRPKVLLVGLGGGTQIHLLARVTRPGLVTVIERDPAIIAVAARWFGLDEPGGLEFLCAEAERVLPWLARTGRRFDFLMEDAAYAEAPPRALALARALVPLVAQGGVLVLNRHHRRDARRAAAALRPYFRDVRVRLVGRQTENALVYCRGARGARRLAWPAAAERQPATRRRL